MSFLAFLNLREVKKWLRGVVFMGSLFVTCNVGFLVLAPVYLTGFALRLAAAQWIYDTLVATWFTFAVGLYELLYGVRVVVQGDVRAMSPRTCTLIVMNHRTRLDWLFYFSVQARYASLRRFKICLKNELRHIPGLGWAMQGAKFLFLKRKWNIDRDRIIELLTNFQSACYAPQLLLFPEGTDYRTVSRQRSREYAEKNNLDDYEHVLHPRTLGFGSIVGLMKQYNQLEQIVDVTVAYPENLPQSEADVMKGNLPRVIVFNVECFHVDSVPVGNDGQLAMWLEERWLAKEHFLREFYHYRDYGHGNGLTDAQNLEVERDLRVRLATAVLFWALLCVFTLYWFIQCSLFRIVFLWGFVVSLAISCVMGIDSFFTSVSVFTENI